MPENTRETLQEILDLPGNQWAYDHVRRLLAERRAMAFVGAGVSTPLYPLWQQLIAAMADAAVAQVGATAADRDFWIQNAATDPLQMARQIRQRLQDPRYFALLYDTFKVKAGADGQTSTTSHRALLALNFKAYITTNYDEGLVQARHVLRPALIDTGFVVWNQPFQINRWINATAFVDDNACPILFAHGHYADPENLVLDRDSYRAAYHDTPYGRLMRELWHREEIVFVGFSFRDEVLKQIADQDLWETVRQGGGPPRHVAILGLPDFTKFSPEMRRSYEDQFSANVLFYPVKEDASGRPDHGALAVLLAAMSDQGFRWQPVTASPPQVVAAPPFNRTVKSRFVHETTEDEKFTGRETVIARLDQWVADPKVSIVGITAIGGTGKTALLATWMRRPETANARPFAATFFWSFYRDRSARSLLKSLMEFACASLGWTLPESDRRTVVDQAIDLLGHVPILLGLDGLEVIQDDPRGLDYGKVLEADLAEFLDRLAYLPMQSFAVLTSRYPFPDLIPFLGSELRLLPLPALEPAEGARLLASMNVRGDAATREAASMRLEGHPLALRVFARSMPLEIHGDPERHWDLVFAAGALGADDPLAAKMERLLDFYAKHLPREQCDTLGLVALFRAPIAYSVLQPLWCDLLGHKENLPSLNDSLAVLRQDHLLTADVGDDGIARYAAHPILRDHFRGILLDRDGFARGASELLAERPGSHEVLSPEDIELLVVAGELLFREGEIEPAMELIDDLDPSDMGIPDFDQFARFTRAGLDAVERMAGTASLTKLDDTLGILLVVSSMAYQHMGMSRELATACARIKAAITGESPKWLPIPLLLIQLTTALREGDSLLFASCREGIRQALLVPETAEIVSEWSNSLPYFLELAEWSLIGPRSDIPATIVRIAVESGMWADLQVYFGLTSSVADALIRVNEQDTARWVTSQLFEHAAEGSRVRSNAAVSDCLGAWLALIAGDCGQSHQLISKAKPILLRARMVYELAKLHLIEARLALAEKHGDLALVAANAALRIAAPRKYRLIHADALNLRSAAWLEQTQGNPGVARDDAEAALHLAESCTYRWAERDSCERLACSYSLLGQPAEAARYKKRFENLKKQLVPPPGFVVIPPSGTEEGTGPPTSH